MGEVFISYSNEDVSSARLMSDKLGAAGFSVWWDRRIMPGKTWDEVIGASLDSASCVVVLWSKVSVQSRWVREEAERGADRGILVPIFIEKVEPSFAFGRIEAADLSGWNGEATDPEFTNVCDAIASFLKAPRNQTPNPQAETGGNKKCGKPRLRMFGLPSKRLFVEGKSRQSQRCLYSFLHASQVRDRSIFD